MGHTSARVRRGATDSLDSESTRDRGAHPELAKPHGVVSHPRMRPGPWQVAPTPPRARGVQPAAAPARRRAAAFEHPGARLPQRQARARRAARARELAGAGRARREHPRVHRIDRGSRGARRGGGAAACPRGSPTRASPACWSSSGRWTGEARERRVAAPGRGLRGPRGGGRASSTSSRRSRRALTSSRSSARSSPPTVRATTTRRGCASSRRALAGLSGAAREQSPSGRFNVAEAVLLSGALAGAPVGRAPSGAAPWPASSPRRRAAAKAPRLRRPPPPPRPPTPAGPPVAAPAASPFGAGRARRVDAPAQRAAHARRLRGGEEAGRGAGHRRGAGRLPGAARRSRAHGARPARALRRGAAAASRAWATCCTGASPPRT